MFIGRKLLLSLIIDMNMNKIVEYKNRIKFKCLIISTIFITSIILSSCAAPRSVRPTSNYLASKKKFIVKPIKENNNIRDFYKQKNNEQEQTKNQENTVQNKAIAGLNNTNLDANGLPVKPTLSLNSQMRLLYESNLKMQKDIELIKKSINQINQQIETINNKKQSPVEQAASPNSAQKENRNINSNIDYHLPHKSIDANDNNNNDDIILSDEENQKIERINFDDKFKNPSTKNPIRFKPNRKRTSPKRNKIRPKETSQLIPTEIKDKAKNDFKKIESIINNKDYQTAIQKLNNLIQKTKDPVQVTICNFYLGESLSGLKQYDKAIDYYRKVIERGNTDKNDDAQFNMAEAFFELGNLKEAKIEYQIFVQKYPKNEKIPEVRKILQQI